MKTEEIYMELFDFSRPTYFKRKREHNKALALIQKYFSEDEVLEFVRTGQIERVERSRNKEEGAQEYILFHAIGALSDILCDLPTESEKESLVSCFLHMLQHTKASSKEQLLVEAKESFLDELSHELRESISSTIDRKLSGYEVFLLLQYRTQTLKRLSELLLDDHREPIRIGESE